MPVVHAPKSAYAEERRKWEATHTEYGPPGRPYTYQPFPTRMYKALRQADGSRTFEAFTANDAHEQRNLESRGFVVGGQQAALDALSAQELEHATLAAEINYDARYRLSEKARADVDAAQAQAGARHLPVVPETPIKKRGRPKKDAASV